MGRSREYCRNISVFLSLSSPSILTRVGLERYPTPHISAATDTASITRAQAETISHEGLDSNVFICPKKKRSCVGFHLNICHVLGHKCPCFVFRMQDSRLKS